MSVRNHHKNYKNSTKCNGVFSRYYCEITLNNVIQLIGMHVGCGTAHSVFIDEDDTVWGVGSSGIGQLGVLSYEKIKEFRRIGNVGDIVQLACAESHTIALRNDGLVYGFGENKSGQLSGGSEGNGVYEPERVFGVRDVAMVATGTAHLLLLDNAGIVWGCGNNCKGQLGSSKGIRIYTPEAIERYANGKVNPVTKIFAFSDRSYIVDDGGELYAFGSNEYSSLGLDDSNIAIFRPTLVLDVHDVIIVGGSKNYSVMIDANGEFWYCGKLPKASFSKKAAVLALSFVPISVACGEHICVCVDDAGSLWIIGEAHCISADGRAIMESFQWSKFTQLDIAAHFTSVSGNVSHFFASTVDNEVYGFGSNHANQVSPKPSAMIFPPEKLSLPFQLKTYEKRTLKSARK